MRIPVLPGISTKDGTSNKNSRLTNVLKETRAAGDIAVVRPGLETSDTYSGIGNGLVAFDGRLLTIYDDTVTDTGITDSYPWDLGSDPWDASATYGLWDSVWYSGILYFSYASSNTGNTPSGSSSYWKTGIPENWDAAITYDIGDRAVVNGVAYYSVISSNLNNDPTGGTTSGYWQTTPVQLGTWRTMNGWDNTTPKSTPMEVWVYNTSIGSPTAYGHYLATPDGVTISCFQVGVADYCAFAFVPPGTLIGNIGIDGTIP